MKKETITRIKLTASAGHMLTDGESFGRIVYLASGNEGEKWHEITEAEYEAKMAEYEAKMAEYEAKMAEYEAKMAEREALHPELI